MGPIDMDALNVNPGIRRTVAWLRGHGFDTCDSGDGKTHDYECDLPFPYVHCRVAPESLTAESHRLFDLLSTHGIDVMRERETGPVVQATYAPSDGFALVSLYGVDDADFDGRPA